MIFKLQVVMVAEDGHQDRCMSRWSLDIAQVGRPPLKERFAKSRDDAAAKLTPDDLSKAQKKAAEWFAAHPIQP